MTRDLIVQQPDDTATLLMLLFHGVGGHAAQMLPLAQRLATEFPQAWIVCVEGPEPSDLGQGWQWFSILGVSEENRPSRVAAGMPPFLAAVHHWQAISGLGAAATALIGFSQGTIMALEACAAVPGLAGRVLAFSGRYASLPAQVSPLTTYHFFHGADDAVIAASHARAAFEHLSALEGGDATLDIADTVGHEIAAPLVERAVFRLTHHIPARLWREAMGTQSAASGSAGPV